MIARHPRVWRNGSGTVRCEPNHRAQPVTLEQIQSEVLRAAEEGERLRVIGNGHSFSPLCWSDDNQMSLSRFTGIESCDVQRQRVWVRAGMRLRNLVEALADRGLALENAPSNDNITLAGAIATGTHGTGAAFGNLATLVTGLRLVGADGSVRQCHAEQDPELFDAARISLGALGVITHIELQCVDSYRLRRQNQRATLGETLAQIGDLRRDHRNFEFFWFPHSGVVVQRRLDETRDIPSPIAPLMFAQRTIIDHALYRVASEVAARAPRMTERATAAMAQRAARHRNVFEAQHAYVIRRGMPCVQMEYAVPVAALETVVYQLERVIRALPFRIPLALEVRFVRHDSLWLSPQYQQDSACIAVPALPAMSYGDYFSAIAEIFARHDGRPHWGSQHQLTAPELRALYPRFDDFCALRRQLDPRGVFLNPHLAALFGVALR